MSNLPRYSCFTRNPLFPELFHLQLSFPIYLNILFFLTSENFSLRLLELTFNHLWNSFYSHSFCLNTSLSHFSGKLAFSRGRCSPSSLLQWWLFFLPHFYLPPEMDLETHCCSRSVFPSSPVYLSFSFQIISRHNPFFLQSFNETWIIYPQSLKFWLLAYTHSLQPYFYHTVWRL